VPWKKQEQNVLYDENKKLPQQMHWGDAVPDRWPVPNRRAPGELSTGTAFIGIWDFLDMVIILCTLCRRR
jgi:hypothetical protein